MTISEKVSYIKGLAEGLSLDTAKPEGKLLAEIVDALALISEEIETIEADVVTAEDYLDELDSDLGDLEEYVYSDEDCDCDCCDCDDDYDDYDDDDDCDCCDCCDDEYYEVTCPNCGETICFDESIDASNLECPACGKKINE
ncbi:MAG: hypothetical protein E7623_02155 [Ruminococcaceae bacterium]|nr:hypothetical protein [Oscillospiraceae bacterium]